MAGVSRVRIGFQIVLSMCELNKIQACYIYHVIGLHQLVNLAALAHLGERQTEVHFESRI